MHHVSQISSACCLRTGYMPEPPWDVMGVCAAGDGTRSLTHTHTHRHAHTWVIVETVTAFVLQPHSSANTHRAQTVAVSFLWISGFQSCFGGRTSHCSHRWIVSRVLFIYFCFVVCSQHGSSSGWAPHIIRELHFMLFWRLILTLSPKVRAWSCLIEDRRVTTAHLATNCHVDESGWKLIRESFLV